jgi:hypothetical protein
VTNHGASATCRVAALGDAERAGYVKQRLDEIAKDEDMRKFIL